MSYRNYSGAWLPDTNQSGVRYVNGSWAGETLYGSDGADQFEGAGGRDTFVGGGGDDFYWVRDTRDVVTEWAGGGVDTIRIWSSYTLPQNVENLVVFGHGSYAAGNDGANIIQGLEGDQFIYGGRGEDVLAGGSGADTFVLVRGEGNKVIEDFQSWSDQVRLVGGDLRSFEAVKAAMSQQGSDVALNDGGTMILFRNASIGQFAARDFQLPLAGVGRLTFEDNFDSLQTGSVWKTNFGFADDRLNSFTLTNNNEQQIYVAPEFKGTAGYSLGLNPYSIGGGVLTLTAQPVSAATSAQMWGYKYASGMLDSHFTQTYGYFEVRADLPDGQGLWPAFWLLGPNNNEIDVLEGLGSDTKVPFNAIHSNEVPADGKMNFMPSGDGFHTYGVLWSPHNLVFTIDGTEVWRRATPSDMDKPMHMIVNLAVGGPWAGSPDASTPWPAQMKVDYIRAYELPGAVSAPPAPAPAPTPAPIPTPQPAPPPPVPSGDGMFLVSPGPGSALRGGAGADTLNASQGADQLTGGQGADVFVFGAMPWRAGAVSDFTPGVDRLDVSALYANGYRGSDPVGDGYVSFRSDGAGGTTVVLDVDGPGGPSGIPFQVVTLSGVGPAGLTGASVFGGSAAPAPTAPPSTGAAGQVLTSAYPGAALNGGSGADTLNASQGADNLSGGAGADHFVFNALPWSAGHIRDFQDGQDILDLRGLFAGSGYWGADPLADRRILLESDGAGGTRVLVDVDGPGGASPWPITVTTLDHIQASSLSGADWLIR